MSPRTVTWVALHCDAPMGQQHYDTQLQRALLAESGDDWAFDARSVAPLRASAPGAIRLPGRALRRAPLYASAAVGSLAYGRSELVHRLDLRVPPRLGPELLTVHDLPPLRFDDEGTLPRWAAASARRARGVICPSEFAAREVRELLGVERTWVVPYGVDPAFADAQPLAVDGRFVLHAAGATERKNLSGLAEAWRRLVEEVEDVELVLCGPPDPRRDELFSSLPRTRIVGRLPVERVAGLMRAAAAVVVPSVYEGFGLPALEGMAAGVPVVAAARGALPEVCGDAALLVEPTREGIAAGLRAVLEDEEVARRLGEAGPARAAGFTWAKAARATLAVYEEALA
jgi:glycosyltransferase involved in cell wall biosynthesis